MTPGEVVGRERVRLRSGDVEAADLPVEFAAAGTQDWTTFFAVDFVTKKETA